MNKLILCSFFLSWSTFALSEYINKDFQYKIVDCGNENRCWGIADCGTHWIQDVSQEKCSSFRIQNSPFDSIREIYIQMPDDAPVCSDCMLNIDYHNHYVKVEKRDRFAYLMTMLILDHGQSYAETEAEENRCYQIYTDNVFRKIVKNDDGQLFESRGQQTNQFKFVKV